MSTVHGFPHARKDTPEAIKYREVTAYEWVWLDEAIHRQAPDGKPQVHYAGWAQLPRALAESLIAGGAAARIEPEAKAKDEAPAPHKPEVKEPVMETAKPKPEEKK